MPRIRTQCSTSLLSDGIVGMKKFKFPDELKWIFRNTDFGMTFWLILPGLFSFAIGFTTMIYDEQSHAWPQTEGKIVSIAVETNSSTGTRTPGWGSSPGHTSHKPVVMYEYTVGGVRYTSSNLFFGDKSFSIMNDAVEIANRYRVGQRVRVYYKPDYPKTSAIETGKGGIPTSLIIGAAFLSIGLLFLVVAVVNRIRSPKI